LDRDGGARLDELIVKHVADVAAYCRWRCVSEEDAQDAVSEVFLIAWRRLGDVPDGDAGRVWLLATARRVISNERRARGRRHRLVERLRLFETHEPVQWPVDLVPGDVADALRRLEPADREILLLAEWEGLNSTEIGAVMGCLAVTARGRLHRARQRFGSVYLAGETAVGTALETAVGSAAGPAPSTSGTTGVTAPRTTGKSAGSGDTTETRLSPAMPSVTTSPRSGFGPQRGG
jgi:RNA polymerase sigma-70 factor (ECF subfamily)